MEAVWVVDDDQSIRWVLERALGKEGLSVRVFDSARACMSALPAGAPRVLVSDIRMPGESGLQLLQQAKAQHPGLPVIIMTAYSDLDSAVSSFQGGAFDYLPKPFDLPKAIALIRRAVEEGEREAAAVESTGEAPELLGQAPAMQEVFRAIGRLSQSNVTVLITGESGSGKELIARPCTGTVPGPPSPSWRSTRQRFRRICSRASCSDMSVARLPERSRCVAVALSRPKAEHCFWMKSVTCPPSCRPVCCAFFQTGTFIGWAGISR